MRMLTPIAQLTARIAEVAIAQAALKTPHHATATMRQQGHTLKACSEAP
jgi:hypothetical protein